MHNNYIDYKDYTSKTYTLSQEGKFEDALELANQMIEKDPYYAPAYMNKGWYLAENFGKEQEAQLYYDIYNNLEEDSRPSSFDHDYKHGSALFSMNEQFVKMAEHILATSENLEEVFNAYEQKSLNLSNLGRTDEALKAVDEFIYTFPKEYNPYAIKGEILYKDGKYADAIIWLDKAISIDSKFHIAYKYKGLCLYALECYEEAAHCYNSSLKDEIYEDVQRDRRRALRKLNKQRGLSVEESQVYQLMLGIRDKNTEEESVKIAIKAFNIDRNRVKVLESMLKEDIRK